jgi:hypothetical protein
MKISFFLCYVRELSAESVELIETLLRRSYIVSSLFSSTNGLICKTIRYEQILIKLQHYDIKR